MFVTYGQHCGDFLLVEYGFVPGAWDGDYVCVDGWMEVSAEQERLLREEGWWGKWVVDVRGFCYRAEAVARLVVGGERRWRRFLLGAEGGTEEEQEGVREFFRCVLGKVRESVRELGGRVEALEAEEEVKDMLRRRWAQIGDIADAAAKAMGL